MTKSFLIVGRREFLSPQWTLVDVDKLNTVEGEFQTIFFSHVPYRTFYEQDMGKWSTHIRSFVNKCLASNGILIVNNYLPCCHFAKFCGFNGPLIITSMGTVVVAKSNQTDLNYWLHHPDLQCVIPPQTVPTQTFSSEILPGRSRYLSLKHLHDSLHHYLNQRSQRFFRNYFRDNEYQEFIGRLTVQIENILGHPNVDPEAGLTELRIMVNTAVYPTSNFSTDCYTMNNLLNYVSYYHDYVSEKN